LDPEAIAEFLGSFRCRAMRAIEAHGGIVDKFVGDDVMGVFGVPIATAEDAANALEAGRALHAEIAAWNAADQDFARLRLPRGGARIELRLRSAIWQSRSIRGRPACGVPER
jgi:class 3 adenylate cyclase